MPDPVHVPPFEAGTLTMKLRDWVPPPHGAEQSLQTSIAPVQSTGHAMPVLHDCVSTSPAAAEHSTPPLLAGVAMMKERVCTPSGPHVSEQDPKSP